MELGKPQELGAYSYFGSDNQENLAMVRQMYVQDLDGDGSQEIIVAGFESQGSTPEVYTNVSFRIFGWQSGRLIDQTAAWLPHGIDRIEGAGDLAFGDYNGDGRVDLFLSAYTDAEHPANSYVFYNQGKHFTRTNLGLDHWKHGADSADINNDGYADVFATGYINPKIYLGGPNGMTKIDLNHFGWGSGVALGDFLGTGRVQVMLVDNWTLWKPSSTGLYTVESDYSLKPHSLLPTPILESDAYQYLGVESHDVAAEPIDFNNDGKLDLLVMSRAYDKDSPELFPSISKLQFLENQGDGTFKDVTDQRLVGWNLKTTIGYEPIIGDFDKDGDNDIFLSCEGSVNSTRILINNNGVYTDTGIDVLGSVMHSWNSVGGIAKDDLGNYHFLVDTRTYTNTGNWFDMSVYPLLFNKSQPINTITTVATATWQAGVSAVNVGSPEGPGPGTQVDIQGKSKTTEVYTGTGNYDILVDDSKSTALFLDDMLSAFPSGQEQSRVNAVEQINMGGGNDIVDLTSRTYAHDDIRILGGVGDDVIWSSLGNDILSGGVGKDILFGNHGKDIFWFDNMFNKDIIEDFDPKQDSIGFDRAVFTSLDTDFRDNLCFSRRDQDSNDYLIYENGILYYDRDGSGPANAVAIAELVGNPIINHDNFLLA